MLVLYMKTVWLSGNALLAVKDVTQLWAGLVLGWQANLVTSHLVQLNLSR